MAGLLWIFIGIHDVDCHTAFAMTVIASVARQSGKFLIIKKNFNYFKKYVKIKSNE